jgi:hypothetical protein
VANQPMPIDSEVQGFLSRLQQYRASLDEPDRRLLDTLVATGLGRKQRDEPEAEVTPYWEAYHNPYTDTTAVATPYGAAGWHTTPWGTTHGAFVHY